MPNVWILQHEDAEPAALIHTVLRRQELSLSVLRPDQEPLPERLPADCSALVVMGGSMAVYEQDRQPWIASELGLLRQALDSARPVLAVCLGAQMLAAAGGGRVYPGDPPKEIGWYTVKVAPEGRSDPLARFLADPATEAPTTVFQWHGDTFDLPPGAVRLARSARFPNQAFRLGRTAYGFQFHFEVTEQMIRSWVALWRKDMQAQGVSADEIFAGLKEHLSLLNRRGEELVRAFAALVRASPVQVLSPPLSAAEGKPAVALAKAGRDGVPGTPTPDPATAPR
jgi:GMP synthase-like glutamine amidotransferase